MTVHEAIFEGGPFDGQLRALQADVEADDPRDREDPPLCVVGLQVANGEVGYVQYLRHKDRNEEGRWHYVFVPPPGSGS